MESRLTELRLKVAQLIGWNQYTLDSIRQAALPFAVSVTTPGDYTDLDGDRVQAGDLDLVARFYAESVMHTAAPGSGSTCLGAAASIPGTIPNRVLATGDLKAGRGGRLTFGHPSGRFVITSQPALGASPNDTRFTKLAFPRTARIICDGRVYIKKSRPPEHSAWVEVDEITAASFFLYADQVSIQK
jgi:hypothetical protein